MKKSHFNIGEKYSFEMSKENGMAFFEAYPKDRVMLSYQGYRFKMVGGMRMARGETVTLKALCVEKENAKETDKPVEPEDVLTIVDQVWRKIV